MTWALSATSLLPCSAQPRNLRPCSAFAWPPSADATEPTSVRKVTLRASFVGFGRRADRSASHWAVVARYSSPPLRVAALRRSSREIVEADRPSRRPISCMEWPWTRRSAISSRSTNDRYRPGSGFAEDLNIAGGMPPAFRNHLVPTGCDTPASTAASSLLLPAAIANQNRLRSSRPATGGRPGDGNSARPDRSDRRFRLLIATSYFRMLRRPLESAQFTSTAFTEVLLKNEIAIRMDGKGAWRDNVFVERLWRSIKYEEVYLKAYDSVSEARASIGRYLTFYNGQRPRSSLGRRTPDQAYFTQLPLSAAA